MSTHTFLLIFSLVYLISLVNFSSSECIPVYMWGNIQYNEPVSPLQVSDQEWFVDFLENHLDKKSPIVVFAEQSLSSEDFSLRNDKGDSIFSALLSTKDSATVNYWPCVKTPVDAVDKLKGRNIVTTSLSQFLGESIQVQSKDVLVIDLDDANDDESRIRMLERHDESIGKIYEKLGKEYKDVSMLFTGRQPSWITVDEVRLHRRIRDTSKAEPIPAQTHVNYVVYSNEDVLISAVDNAMLYNNGTQILLKNVTITTENKTENNLYINMPVDTVIIKWHFQIGSGYWSLKNITVSSSTASTDEADYYFRVKEVYAPHRFSYHCGNQTLFYPMNSDQNITLDYLQIQVYWDEDKQLGKFGDAFDCVGFMSTPIWSGLFVTFILVLIMTCGLTMMMDIKTMDRFDDPKGKTITIIASE
ncbi:hypothetical protein RN001_016146 [Aquatica leii]|uniref:V-type proton ATPase subunit S1 n=1 Tax=Aquatica leii TaxID=1421715 RepID=A0AAN7NX71_9COLE|nr:hypothetical protein RN001_016146 [Aquatica leii]